MKETQYLLHDFDTNEDLITTLKAAKGWNKQLIQTFIADIKDSQDNEYFNEDNHFIKMGRTTCEYYKRA